MASLGERLRRSWNVFRNPDIYSYASMGAISSIRVDRPRLTSVNGRTIVNSIYNQIAVDCAAIDIRHVRLNEDGKYLKTIQSNLNNALCLSANIDQSGRDLIRDIVISMLDEGSVALVPVVTDEDPTNTESYEVCEIRTGKVVEWLPRQVRVEVYNEIIGRKERILLEKRLVPIIENPFYLIMNEPNSTAQRLNRILSQVDRANDESTSGKLDLIIQLPYAVRSDLKRQQAEQRRKDIETQLTGSKYGIAYTDVSEKVIQLNRSLENNLWGQAKDLQAQLFNELGFSQAIFDGTADEKTMLNYYNRTIEPIVSAISIEIERKWLSQTARTQRQGIRYFKDPFKLVPVSQIAEIADKFTRNEIMTSNEIRAVIALPPVDDPKANMLINSNLNQSEERITENIQNETVNKEKEVNVNESR